MLTGKNNIISVTHTLDMVATYSGLVSYIPKTDYSVSLDRKKC